MKIKPAGDRKWFLYLSRTKLEMLFSQIATFEKSKRTVEWKATVPGLGSVTRKTDTEDEPDNYDKLKVVIDALEASGLVGSIYEPNEYIKGVFPMRWGTYDDYGTRPEEFEPLVYFGGFDGESKILLGMGGSSKHVLGWEGSTSTHSRSVTSVLVRALLRGLEYPGPEALSVFDPNDPNGYDENQEVMTAMAIAQHYLRPPTQPLEFFARILLPGTVNRGELYIGVDKAAAILATPLYVAVAHPYPNDDHWGLIPD